MINKVYEKVKEYIKENKYFFLSLIIILVLSYIELPYYINAPGGLVNLDNKVIIEGEYESSGSLNMAYVTEYKSSILMLMYAYLNPNCDIYKQEEYIIENDTKEDMIYREKLEMQEAVDNAIILGYQKAGKEVSITKTNLYVTYILKEADTDLVVGDQIIKIDNKEVFDKQQLNDLIQKEPLDTKFELTVINNGKMYNRYAVRKVIEDYTIIGVTITSDLEYSVDPLIEFKFKNNESGPSGGLMTTLEIYNELTNNDITKGYTIAGTGTISLDGSVGSIGGVKYKLKGAVKKKADIFLVPAGDNYNEAIKEKQEHKYNIEIISVQTFDEALNYLNELEIKK